MKSKQYIKSALSLEKSRRIGKKTLFLFKSMIYPFKIQAVFHLELCSRKVAQTTLKERKRTVQSGQILQNAKHCFFRGN